MAASRERLPAAQRADTLRKTTFADILVSIPETVDQAMRESRESEQAMTPEGKFSLAYLLATQRALRPVLADVNNISADLLSTTGGNSYNPERTIDEVGMAIINYLARNTDDIDDLWIRVEEQAQWQRAFGDETIPTEGKQFAVIDPLDMTHGITKGNRAQTTGIAIYDRQGSLKVVGIASLVDDGFLFMERNSDKSWRVFHSEIPQDTAEDPEHIRVATLTRRMYTIHNTPLMKEGGIWAMDCTSGYATLGMMNGKIDTIVDPKKGNPWYEVAIWVRAAQALGYPVTDRKGNPIDISAAIRRMIEHHESDTFRIPFIVSRTPEIHAKVLELLKKETVPPS